MGAPAMEDAAGRGEGAVLAEVKGPTSRQEREKWGTRHLLSLPENPQRCAASVHMFR